MKRNKESGIMSLEASISLSMFLFFMFFLYSLFVVFEARNVMAHTLLATTNSLSIDAYETDKIHDAGENVIAMAEKVIGSVTPKGETENFVSKNEWYKRDSFSGTIHAVTPTDPSVGASHVSQDMYNVVRSRFIAYLGASDEAAADAILERYHIKGGMDGIDFTGTYIKGDDLYVTITYTIEYEINFFNLTDNTFTHTACSKLWRG